MTSYKSLKAKILFTLLLSIIPLLLFIFYIFDLWHDVSRSSYLDSSINQAKLVANTVDESLRLGITASAIIANSPTVKAALTSKPTMLEGTIKTIVANLPEISAIDIANPSGKTIVYAPDLNPEYTQQVSLADRDYFQEVLATKKAAVSDPLKSKFRNIETIVMASPVIEEGQIKAVVASAFDVEVLKKKMEKVLSVDKKNIVLLYDKNGRLVFILNKPLPTEEEKTVFNNSPFLANKDRNTINIIENQKLPSSDKLYSGASVPVEGFGWTVVSLASVDDIFAPLYKVQAVTWLILLTAFLFALSISSFALRKIKISY